MSTTLLIRVYSLRGSDRPKFSAPSQRNGGGEAAGRLRFGENSAERPWKAGMAMPLRVGRAHPAVSRTMHAPVDAASPASRFNHRIFERARPSGFDAAMR